MNVDDIENFSKHLDRSIKYTEKLYKDIISFWDNLYSDGLRDVNEFFDLTCKYFHISRPSLEERWLEYILENYTK